MLPRWREAGKIISIIQFKTFQTVFNVWSFKNFMEPLNCYCLCISNCRWLAASLSIINVAAAHLSAVIMTTTPCAGVASAALTKLTLAGSQETSCTSAACASHADASPNSWSWLSAAAILAELPLILSRDRRKLTTLSLRRKRPRKLKRRTRNKCLPSPLFGLLWFHPFSINWRKSRTLRILFCNSLLRKLK